MHRRQQCSRSRSPPRRGGAHPWREEGGRNFSPPRQRNAERGRPRDGGRRQRPGSGPPLPPPPSAFDASAGAAYGAAPAYCPTNYYGAYGGVGAYGGCGGAYPQGGAPAAMPGEKKKKKKRGASSSSSSSSSSDEDSEDWRNKVWNQGFQGMWPGMLPGGMPQQMGQPGWPGHDGAAAGSAPPGWGMPPGPPGSLPPPPPMRESGSSSRMHEVAPRMRERSRTPPRDDVDVPIFLEPAIEEFVPVPKALLGKVIGKQAQTIIEIREKSGAFKVDARDQTSDPCLVKIAGTAEAVKKARALIEELLESTKNTHTGSDFVEIPKAKIGMVIGIKGSQVNDIQKETNTKIDFSFDSDPCKVYIKGAPLNVEKAKQVLLTIAMQIEDEASEYIELPKSTSGCLIGVGGSRIREFHDKTGARVDIDKTGNICKVRINGTKDEVALAKHMIFEELEKDKAHRIAQRTVVTPNAYGVVPPALAGHVTWQGDGTERPGPMQSAPNQPAGHPTTLAESIARAQAAAQAVANGLEAGPVGWETGYDSFAGIDCPPIEEPSWEAPQPGVPEPTWGAEPGVPQVWAPEPEAWAPEPTWGAEPTWAAAVPPSWKGKGGCGKDWGGAYGGGAAAEWGGAVDWTGAGAYGAGEYAPW